MRIAVVGGGITGLAAAWEAVTAGADVTVYEAGGRFGGKLLTTRFAGRLVDAGADAFLTRVAEARVLCEEVGLGESLVSPAVGAAYVWSGGRMQRIPDGVLGVPLDGSVTERAAPPLGPDDDPSVGAFIRRRLGDEVADHWVGPLVGAINAGDIDRLSLRAVTPQFAAAADTGPSLLSGLRASREVSAGSESPIFEAPIEGMGALAQTAVEALEKAGAELRLRSRVEALSELDDSFDGVVLTVPAVAAAPLVRPVAPEAADLLDAVEYVSVVVVTLAVPVDAIGVELDASGFLVPRGSGLLMTACSWATTKWAHLDREDGLAVLRVSAGRAGDERALALDDSDLVNRLVVELGETMGLRAAPVETRVTRWPVSFPQYAPGHLDRVAAVDAVLAQCEPRVVVAGAGLRGLGVPACIRQGREAVRRLLGVQPRE